MVLCGVIYIKHTVVTVYWWISVWKHCQQVRHIRVDISWLFLSSCWSCSTNTSCITNKLSVFSALHWLKLILQQLCWGLGQYWLSNLTNRRSGLSQTGVIKLLSAEKACVVTMHGIFLRSTNHYKVKLSNSLFPKNNLCLRAKVCISYSFSPRFSAFCFTLCTPLFHSVSQ